MLCAEVEETAEGAKLSSCRRPATRERVPAFQDPFWPRPATEEPLCLRSGKASQAVCVAQQGPGRSHICSSWPKPCRPTARGCGHSVEEKGSAWWRRRKLLELLAISEEPVTQRKVCIS